MPIYSALTWIGDSIALPVVRRTVSKHITDPLAASILLAGFVLRFLLIFVGEWLDTFALVRYSDVDYDVFSDAAREVAAGRSPYERATYRYTPLLAFGMLPNIWLPCFGKLVFTIADVAMAYISIRTLELRGISQRSASLFTAAFLLHPFAINVSTRGNADSVVCIIVVAMIHQLYNRKLDISAVLYGLAVHVKIYPVIYALPVLGFLNDDAFPAEKVSQGGGDALCMTCGKFVKPVITAVVLAPLQLISNVLNVIPGLNLIGAPLTRLHAWLSAFATARRVGFGVVSLLTFAAITAALYWLYGWQFMYETYLYHFGRVDARHNFSPYFYDLYLRWSAPLSPSTTATMTTTAVTTTAPSYFSMHSLLSSHKVAAIMSFLPQFGTVLVIGWLYHADLAFALFLQTWIFVAWNKVLTVQYFHWYTALMPLILPQSWLASAWGNTRARWTAIGMFLVWLVTELHWNFWAYWLELEGQCAFVYVWMAGLVFFFANVFVISLFIRFHSFSPVFGGGKLQKIGKQV